MKSEANTRSRAKAKAFKHCFYPKLLNYIHCEWLPNDSISNNPYFVRPTRRWLRGLGDSSQNVCTASFYEQQYRRDENPTRNGREFSLRITEVE